MTLQVKPKRIQRQRTKGWRMPDNAIYVGRPTLWGNPYPVRVFGRGLAIELFGNTARGMWIPTDVSGPLSAAAYVMHHEWLKRLGRFGAKHPREAIRIVLGGYDLSCWCPLNELCHADVLLEIANAEMD